MSRRASPEASASWDRLTEFILAALAPGDLLDALVVRERPAPGILRSMPGQAVLEQLKRERNLYGISLEAAVTKNPEEILESAAASKERVRRALALNPNLPAEARAEWLSRATRKADVRLVLALLRGSPDLFATLATNPAGVVGISRRDTQPGPDLVLPAALRSNAQSLRRFVDAHKRSPDNADFGQQVLGRLIRGVSDDEFQLEIDFLLGICESIKPHQQSSTLYLPRGLREKLSQGIGEHVFKISKVFTDSLYSARSERFPLHHSGDFSEEAVLAALPSPPTRPTNWSWTSFNARSHTGFFVQTWSEVAARFLAQKIAEEFSTLDDLDTLKVLMAEWSGTVGELLVAARNL